MIFCWIPNNRPWGNFLLNYAMDYLSLFLFYLLGLHRVPLSKDVTGVPHIKQSLDSSTFEIQKSYCPPSRELC